MIIWSYTATDCEESTWLTFGSEDSSYFLADHQCLLLCKSCVYYSYKPLKIPNKDTVF